MSIAAGITYSFFWYFLINKKWQANKKNLFCLLCLTLFFFFTNYNSIWIIPIWPMVYLSLNFNWHNFKKIIYFFTSFLIGISWFLPTFFKNLQSSVGGNQWAPEVSFFNSIELVGEYFGLLLAKVPAETLNPAVLPFIALFTFVIIYSFISMKNKFPKALLAYTMLSFFLFIIVSFLTGRRLFYSRTSITIVIALYILLAEIFTHGDRLIKLCISILVALQFSQFFIYFSLVKTTISYYVVFNYQVHPMSKFQDYGFTSSDCLATLPRWNYRQAQYYLADFLTVIETEDLLNGASTNSCKNLFLLDQSSVDRQVVANDLLLISQRGFILREELVHDNQILYHLNGRE